MNTALLYIHLSFNDGSVVAQHVESASRYPLSVKISQENMDNTCSIPVEVGIYTDIVRLLLDDIETFQRKAVELRYALLKVHATVSQQTLLHDLAAWQYDFEVIQRLLTHSEPLSYQHLFQLQSELLALSASLQSLTIKLSLYEN